jgi:hypothetical protein
MQLRGAKLTVEMQLLMQRSAQHITTRDGIKYVSKGRGWQAMALFMCSTQCKPDLCACGVLLWRVSHTPHDMSVHVILTAAAADA